MGLLDSFKAKKGMGPPMPGKRPALEVAIGVGRPKSAPTDDPAAPDTGSLSPEEHMVGNAVMSALQSGDSVSFSRALKAFMACCAPDTDDTATPEPSEMDRSESGLRG